MTDIAAGRVYVFPREKEVEFFTNCTVATLVSILVAAAYGDDVVVFGWIRNCVTPDPPYVGGCSNEYLEKYPGDFVQLGHICMEVVGKCKRIYYKIGSFASFKNHLLKGVKEAYTMTSGAMNKAHYSAFQKGSRNLYLFFA